MKRIKFITGKVYEQEFLDLFQNDDRRSNGMTTTRIQPFRAKFIIITGYSDNVRVYPSFIADRKKAFYFCENWKSECIGFRKAMEQLKADFKVIDNHITDKHETNFLKKVYKRKK